MSEQLVQVTRGNVVESSHNGTVVVVNEEGQVIASIGDAQRKIYARSSMKLFQVIPALEAGIVERYKLTAKDVSLFCASHNGEHQHTDEVLKCLHKAGLDYNHLQCGTHPPRHMPTYEDIIREGKVICAIHNNCSGKHTGMLLTAAALGEDIHTYFKLEHPVQQRILQTISELCEYSLEDIELGVDGCGVPVHCLPMYNIALGYANLATNNKYNETRKQAITTMLQSIVKEPQMIGGTDRFCTDLTRVCEGALVGKAGAEGVYCISHLQKKLGIVIKIDDGNSRASFPVAMEVLKQLQLITGEQYKKLEHYAKPTVLNVRKEVVGQINTTFTL